MRLQKQIVAFQNLPHFELLFSIVHLLAAGVEHFSLIISHLLIHQNGEIGADDVDADLVFRLFHLKLSLREPQLALPDAVIGIEPVENIDARADTIVAAKGEIPASVRVAEVLTCTGIHRRSHLKACLLQLDLRCADIQFTAFEG